MTKAEENTTSPIVWVEWVDSQGPKTQTWYSPDELSMEPITILSAGFLLNEDDISITLCLNISEGGDVHGLITIPRGCVVSWGNLEKGTDRA